MFCLTGGSAQVVVCINQQLTGGGSLSTMLTGEVSNITQAVANSLILTYHEMSR